MHDEVAWRVEAVLNSGATDEFLALTAEMVASARNEFGVLSYQRFISADGNSIHIYERYVNSEAAVAHLRNFAAQFAKRFSNLVTRKRFTVYGEPTAELSDLLSRFGASEYLQAFGDLPYWAS